ncbi:MAG: TldD/PmbA family protein [Lachnospiraceae bacterium]|nr:TldD/PmbA family protein [Lachnospiraceae bacterium]
MFERIKTKLQASGASAWELTEETVRGWEFYFIRHELDQNRAVQTREYRVRVYVPIDGGAFQGEASGTIDPTASEAEIDRTLADLLFQASLVKNKPYTVTDRAIDIPDETAPVDVPAIAESFLRAMDSVAETPAEDVNSYEIFVKEITRRFENSNGVTYSCVYPSSMAEVVVNARREGHEIELYRQFRSGTCDMEKLRADVEEAMRCGRDRLVTEPTPLCDGAPVLLSGQNAVEVYAYFLDRMSAGFKVRGISDWEVGKPVVPGAQGDAVSVKAVPHLPNSSRSVAVDEEGRVIRERYIVKDGVAENFWGSRQMSEYLGLADSSLVYNAVVSGGTHAEEELREGDWLEVMEFSDFHVDAAGGDVAGEIRLAYWHHDGKTVPVSGGSVSGSIAEAARGMTFTAETVQQDTWVVPKLTRLPGLRITGVK